MNHPQIILASKSPRRAELLRQIGIRFVIKSSGIPEQRKKLETPSQYVQRLALAKARKSQEGRLPSLGADTTVIVEGLMLEKPSDLTEALHMLDQLNGRSHTVLTAIAICDAHRQKTILASAEVRFRDVSSEERLNYCHTGEPFDKAGAYGVQGIGAVMIEGIVGQPSTVAGLPLVETNSLLIEFGVDVWRYRTKKPSLLSDG